jgi:uncharacterized membrane protein
MTIGEVVAPVMIPIAFVLAVVATLLLLRHVAVRYPAIPARIPARLGIDGRPSNRLVGKAVVWVPPVAMAVILAVLGVLLLTSPPREDQRTVIALVFVIFAETAWCVGWSLDRQIEVARKMTYRVSPARTLRVMLPLLATIAITLVIAART